MPFRSGLWPLFLFPLLCPAQTAPALAVDAAANRHPISPDIYGINDYSDHGLASVARVGVRRWGGDATSRYNWMLDTYNSGSDYYFENYAYPPSSAATLPNGSQFDHFIETGLSTGTKRLGTIPVMGWLPKTRDNVCSYSVAKYGAQQQVDPYHTDCGNGYLPDGKTKITNDPHDASQPMDQSFAAQWIKHVIGRYGAADRGGVQIWSLDNEPEWWFGVHMDIHPQPSSYDEILQRGITYASAIKAADPAALVSGHTAGGWSGMFYSATDFVSGWNTFPYQFYDNPVDRNAHGGVALAEWYLQQMNNYERQNGIRLLDYIDVHAYISPKGIEFGTATDSASTALRLTSTRVFWDPNYAAPDGSTPSAQTPAGEPPYLVPRMKQWVASDYPGTRTAITEYNWGAVGDVTGAVAEADILGIFGREGLDLAAMWGPPDPTKSEPATFAFELYTNYDGAGSQFGETSISATTGNPDSVSIFAAHRSDGALTIVLLNKNNAQVTAPVLIANFLSGGQAQVWQYGSANLKGIQHVGDTAVNGGSLTATLPPYSLTLLVLPQDASTRPVPQPSIGAVANAASYDASGVAPGELVVIFGSNLGPASLVPATVTSNNFLTTTLSDVRVLVNGIAAPLVYVSATQISAIIPYEVSLFPSASIQVEVQGVRSVAFSMALTATAPALFSRDATGAGQGAILNQDLSVNGATKPAHGGDTIVLYGTGEGATNPPGADGRLALDILPSPQAACSVTIGGQPAVVSYCGAAPDLASGVFQINAQVPAGTLPGNIPVSVQMGQAAAKPGITLAVE